MLWDDGLTDLQYELADLYFHDDRIRSVAVEAGIPSKVLDLDGAPISDWHVILREAVNRDKVDDLVAIAVAEYPSKAAVLQAALDKHTQGVGAFSSVLADFNRAISENLRQVLIGLAVAIMTSWVLSNVGGRFWQREFVILLQFAVLLFTPFFLRAVVTRLRIPIGMIPLIGLSLLLILAEAALFSEIASNSQLDSVVDETRRAITLDALTVTTVKVLEHAAFTDNPTLKNTKTNTVTIQEGGAAAQITQERLAPQIYAQVPIEWKAREALPGLSRNYTGTILFVYQVSCENGEALLERIKTNVALSPGSDPRSWLIGFIQIPYLRDLDNDILVAVDQGVHKSLEQQHDICDAF